MARYLTILALVLFLGCVPQAINCPQVTVYVPPVEVVYAPDLNGCVYVETDAHNAAGSVVGRVDPFWFVLTAKHVIEGAISIKVDGAEAELFAYSLTADLALLRVNSQRNYTIYGTAEARLGEPCWVVGHPFPGRVVNRGHISKVYGGLCHNAGGCPGFSGGPVLGLRRGQPVLLGVTTACLAFRAGPFSYNVYDSIAKAESGEALKAMLEAIPPKQ